MSVGKIADMYEVLKDDPDIRSFSVKIAMADNSDFYLEKKPSGENRKIGFEIKE